VPTYYAVVRLQLYNPGSIHNLWAAF